MLTKSTYTKYSYLRRVMVLPILIVTVCLLSIKVNASEKIEKTAKAIQNTIDLLVNDTTKPKKITPPTPPNPSTAKPDYYINGAKIAEGTPPPPPLTNPSYYLDGVKITEKEMKDISINGIASINVLKGEQAIKKYREDGKNGVVEINLKVIQRKDQLPNKEWSNINANQNQIKSLEMANGVKIEFKGKFNIDTAVGDKKTPLYILDGVALKSSIEISKLNPEEFESVSVLKNPSSISLYGNEGKNGVILITTKTGLKGNLQKKSDEINVFEYNAKEGLDGDVYYKKIEDGNNKAETNVPIKVTNVPKIQLKVDPSKNNDPIFYTAEKPAEFPGGTGGWSNYLMKNLDRNLPNRNKAVPGRYTVKLNFIVSKDGDVENVIAENNPGYGTASEAIRVIEKGPKWIPAEQNGKKVNYLMKQVIVFNVTDK